MESKMRHTILIIFAATVFYLILIRLNAQAMKDFEGNVYKTVPICKQVCLAENLNTAHYKNEDPISQALTVAEWEECYKKKKETWCYNNNDPKVYIDTKGYFSIKPPKNWKAVHTKVPPWLKCVIYDPSSNGVQGIFCIYIAIRKFTLDTIYSEIQNLQKNDGDILEIQKTKFKGYDAIIRTFRNEEQGIYTVDFFIQKTLHRLTYRAKRVYFDNNLPLILKSIKTYKPTLPNEERDWEYAQERNDSIEYREFLYQYPNSKYLTQTEKNISDLFWKKIVNRCTIEGYLRFIEIYPTSSNSIKARECVDQMKKHNKDWEQVLIADSIPAYQNFTSQYPNSPYSIKATHYKKDIQKYDSARFEDWYSSYESYLTEFPEGKFADTALNRLKWLKSHKAEFSVDYPTYITGGSSPYSNVSSPFFKWSVTFYEKSGKMGYKVKGSGWYYDNKGDAWGNQSYGRKSATEITTEELTINAGGNKIYDTWFSGSKFVGGNIRIDFVGEDAGGHPINIKVRIHCK